LDRAYAAAQIHRSVEAKQQEVSAQVSSFQAVLAAIMQQLGSLSQQQAANSGGLAAFFAELGQQVATLAPITAGTQQQQQQGGDGSQLALGGDDAAAALQQQNGGVDEQHGDEGHGQQGFVAGTQVGGWRVAAAAAALGWLATVAAAAGMRIQLSVLCKSYCCYLREQPMAVCQSLPAICISTAATLPLHARQASCNYAVLTTDLLCPPPRCAAHAACVLLRLLMVPLSMRRLMSA
jgi:hypothetical protein